MSHFADRVGGAFFIVFGLVLYFAVIPAQTEPAESGWIFPDTVPNAIAWLLCILGGWLLLSPSIVEAKAWRTFPRSTLFLILIVGGTILMDYAGFVWVAPFLAMCLMWLMGERRKLWLGLGVLMIPALIWVLVVPVLERVLP